MATTYELTDTASDLSGGADFDVDLNRTSGPSPPSPPAPGSLTINVAQSATETSYAYTIANDPNNADWETGTITVEVEVTTADSNIDLKLSASRVDSGGAVQETSGSSSELTLSSTGQFNFTIPSTDWTAGNAGDRIRINYIFTNTILHGSKSVIIETSTADTEHVTQITFNAGDIVVTPAALTAVATTVNPTVVLGSVSVTPAVRTAVAAVIAPVVILGSLSITPAVTTSVVATVDPVVINSGDVTQKQIFVTGPGWQSISGSEVRYNTVLSNRISSANHESTELSFQLIGTPGTLRNLRIDLDTAITSGGLTCTIRKNQVDTGLEVVISSGTTGSDLTTDLAVAAGDQINMQLTGSATMNTVRPRWSLEFEGNNDKEFNMSAGTSNLIQQVSSTQFNGLTHHDIWSTTDTDRIQICPLDGTIKAWYLELDAAPGSGESWTFRITKNLTSEASSEIVISGTGTTGNVTGLVIDIAPGDRLQIQGIRSSASVVLSRIQSGVAIQADTAGESWVGGWSVNPLTTVDTVEEYLLFGSGKDNWGGTSSQHLQAIGGSYTLKNFRIRASASPGGTADHQYTFKIRKNDAAGSSVVTLTDAETTKVDTTNTDSFTPGDSIGISHRYDLLDVGTPNAMTVTWAAIQTIDDNIVVTPAALTMVGAVVNPTVVLGSVSVTPPALTVVAVTVNPTVVLGSMTVTPAVLTAVAVVVDPTVLNFVLLTPSALTAVAATVDPTVVLGSVSVAPAALTTVASTVDPTVILGSVSVTPVALTAVAATVNPTVVLGSMTVTPTALTVVATVVDPTVILGSMSVTPAALTAVAAVVDPTVILGSVTITPAALTAVAAVVDPTVIVSGGDITVTPAALTAVAATVNPTVILGSVSITPAVLTAVAAVVDPTVLNFVLLTPAALTAVVTTVNPTVVLGSITVTPAALSAVTAKVDPTVVLGSITITPAALTVVAATVDPTVIIGDLTITPAALTVISATVNPTVILGSLTVTPAALSAVAATVDPTVILGSVTVIPTVITTVAAIVDPTVILGSLTITPAVLTAVSAVVDPTIVLSGGATVTPAALSVVALTRDPTVLHSGTIKVFIVRERISTTKHSTERIATAIHSSEEIAIG